MRIGGINEEIESLLGEGDILKTGSHWLNREPLSGGRTIVKWIWGRLGHYEEIEPL